MDREVHGKGSKKGYKSLLEDGTSKGLEIPQDDVTSDISAEVLSEEYFDAGEGVESSEETKKDGAAKKKADPVTSSGRQMDSATKARIEKEIRHLNDAAHTDLVLSMDTSKASGMIAFNLIRKTRSKKYKNGNAYLAWKNLLGRWSPKDKKLCNDAHDELHAQRHMKQQDKDPEVYILKMEHSRTKMAEAGNELSDE